MARRLLAPALALTVLMPTPAHAWANGPEGPDSYGTHDMLLAVALDKAHASWVMRGVALRATDDPDTRDGIDHASGTWWHVYDIWGDTYGGAPEAAKVWFNRIQRRLDNGNRRGASKALGYLAHIVGDISQPMHTDGSDREERIHSAYESDVDERSFNARWDGRDPAKPYRRTVQLAKESHREYRRLVRLYSENGWSKRVGRITKRQLGLGMNALADIIDSL